MPRITLPRVGEPHQFLAFVAALLISTRPCPANGTVTVDVVVYAATPSGIMASIAAAREGEAVALVEPSAHIGGVVSGGLTVSDVGRAETIGGLAREFFNRVLRYYIEKHGAGSQQVKNCANGYRFEPHVAEAIFGQMLSEQPRLHVWRCHRIRSVTVEGGKVIGLACEDLAADQPQSFAGAVFVDASYTGDLMAMAGVAYRVGRESREEFGEPLAGLRGGGKEVHGRGDHRIQAFNYRVCMTNRAGNRVPVPRPDGYDPVLFNAPVQRVKDEGIKNFASFWDQIDRWRIPNEKIDANIADRPGVNDAYPEGDWETRSRIETEQRHYSLGLLYSLQNDPQLPEEFRASAREWGLPKDEFEDNDHFPHQIYIREARRMIGRYVLREQDVTEERHKPDGICLGSYNIDCHAVQRLSGPSGWMMEGFLDAPTQPYEIPYRCLTPSSPSNLLVTVCMSATHVAYCTVRMEPVYMMVGHAAGVAASLAHKYGHAVQEVEIERLRHVLREQGQILDAPFEPRVGFTWEPKSPGPDQPVAFQISELEVRDPLVKFWWDFDGDGTVDSKDRSPIYVFAKSKSYTVSLLVADGSGDRSRYCTHVVSVGGSEEGDVTLDEGDEGVTSTGGWRKSSAIGTFYGPSYYHDDNQDKGKRKARYRPNLPRAGRYLVCLSFSPGENRASKVPVTIHHRNGETVVILDQRVKSTVFPFVPVGEYTFDAGTEGFVLISNEGTDGYVLYDAVRWVWVGGKGG